MTAGVVAILTKDNVSANAITEDHLNKARL